MYQKLTLQNVITVYYYRCTVPGLTVRFLYFQPRPSGSVAYCDLAADTCRT